MGESLKNTKVNKLKDKTKNASFLLCAESRCNQSITRAVIRKKEMGGAKRKTMGRARTMGRTRTSHREGKGCGEEVRTN